jgi:diacylglycerol kinase (ATP)
MKNNTINLKRRVISFVFAWNGLWIFLREEPNSLIHLTVGCLAIIAGIILKISRLDWMAIFFAIGFVLVTEILNTSIERLADHSSPEFNDQIKQVKDIAAGAVLMSAFTAVVIGFFVFLPKIIQLFAS